MQDQLLELESNNVPRKVAVILRTYEGISKIPFITGKNKADLVCLCLRSLLKCNEGINLCFYCIYDNCSREYEERLKEVILQSAEYIPIHLPRSGNAKTFDEQIRIAIEQEFSSTVFLLEDDYLFRPGSIRAMYTFLAESGENCFVTPYDHSDYYSISLHTANKYEIRISSGSHWRTSYSTCLTFMTKKDTLRKCRAIFKTYENRNSDFAIWLMLTAGISYWIKMLFKKRDRVLYFKTLCKTIVKGNGKILLYPKMKLWVPIPSLGTHLQYDGVAPIIKWSDIAHQV